LSNVHTPRIDAVIYNSAQTKGGRNIVLFNHAIIVEQGPEFHGDVDIWDHEDEITLSFGTESQADKLVETHRHVSPNLESDLQDRAGEAYLELAQDSLKLIKAESISYELDIRSIHFYRKDIGRVRKF